MPAPFTFADAREILTPQGNGVIPGFAEPSGDAQQRPDAEAVRAAGKNARGEYRYGEWRIEYRPPPIPIRTMDWQFWHDDYDGAPDGNDLRCGAAASIEAAITEIHIIEELEAELV